MNTTGLSSDSYALVLLASHLGLPKGEGDLRPLSPAELAQIETLANEGQGPGLGWLLGMSASELSAALRVDETEAGRLAGLLGRGGQVAIEIERLQSQGAWVLTRADPAYPWRVLQRLGSNAPPVLAGAGPASALSAAGVAVVGSRELDDEGSVFAEEVGIACARQGSVAFSGAAKGADRISMLAAAENGGLAVGVLADSLLRFVRDRACAEYIRRGRLTLVTQFHPAAPFDVRRAMARNKLIYCLSTAAVVVSTSLESGGTWAGAKENLKAGWVPLYVRVGADVPPGNLALIRAGGKALSLPEIRDGWLPATAAAETAAFETTGEHSPAVAKSTEREDFDSLPSEDEGEGISWSDLEPFLADWHTTGEIVERFGLAQAEVQRWLARGLAEGLLTLRSGKEKRYRASGARQMPLM